MIIVHQLDVSVGFHGGKALNGPLALIGMIESPVAINTLSRICEYGVNNLVNLKLEALVFGADDYLSSIGNTTVLAPSSSMLIYCCC